MKKCEKCGTADIQDQYKYCLNCLNDIKSNNSSADLITALGQINNNLYAIRTQMDVFIGEKYGVEVKWSKLKKDFVIQAKDWDKK